MTLSTREIAISIWGCVFLIWVLSVSSVRRSLFELIRAALRWKLSVPAVIVILYLVLVVKGLSLIRFWNPALLKDTIVWVLFSGLALAFSAVNLNAQAPTWRSLLTKQAKIIVLIEYVITSYTFSLWVELLLIPALTGLVMLDAVARSDKKYSQVAKLTGFLVAATGFAILWFAVHSALSAAESVSMPGALRGLLLPLVLSLTLLPLVYIFFLISAYEQLFLVLQFGSGKEPGFIRYAKRRLFYRLGVRSGKVRSFLNTQRLALMSAKTIADIDELLNRKK